MKNGAEKKERQCLKCEAYDSYYDELNGMYDLTSEGSQKHHCMILPFIKDEVWKGKEACPYFIQDTEK